MASRNKEEVGLLPVQLVQALCLFGYRDDREGGAGLSQLLGRTDQIIRDHREPCWALAQEGGGHRERRRRCPTMSQGDRHRAGTG